jgi:hypothetical protein
MKGFRASSEREPDEFDRPALRRFFGADPFPWVLAICVLIWLGLGLATKMEPLIGFVLVAVGLLVCLLSQVWLYVSIFQEDAEAGFFSLLSGWYRVFYLYMNPDLAWRPSVLAGVGLLMAFTGIGLFMTGAR